MNPLVDHLKKVAKKYSLLGDRLYLIENAINKTLSFSGEIWECGAFKGGTGLYMKACLIQNNSNKTVRLFDTFCGMPNSTQYDAHQVGSFSEASFETAKNITAGLDKIHIHVGEIPKTFIGLESCRIDVAHIDVDNYLSVKACIEFIYPRVPIGGIIIVDDYNDSDCLGAKKAVSDFLKEQHILFNRPNGIFVADNPANPQAFIIK
jgi:O-methyltransferase